jgi:hypothetical protein
MMNNKNYYNMPPLLSFGKLPLTVGRDEEMQPIFIPTKNDMGYAVSSKMSPYQWAVYAREQGEIYGWPYAHVLANAGITKDWGPLTSWSFSTGKEFLDLGKGLLGNKESLYSAFQPIDFRMNHFGRQIGLEMKLHPVPGETLEMRLEQFKFYPEGNPGPFYNWLIGSGSK